MQYKDLVDWVNKEFVRYEITEYVATSAQRTYFNQDAIEGGACRMYIHFKATFPTPMPESYFLCFYTLKQINQHLKDGYTMYLKFDRNLILRNTTIELRKE